MFLKAAFDNSYLVDEKDIKLGQKLGDGGFGVVYSGTYKNAPVAIKQLKIENLSANDEKEFKNEIRMMAKAIYPNILTLYGCYCSPSYGIVMELMHCSLRDVLHNGKNLPWKTRYQIACDIASGLSFLHSHNILHRDLKSANVLLSSTMRAKIADLGLAKVKFEVNTLSITNTKIGRGVGTEGWMAPELISNKPKYSKKSDIYACGVTFWEIGSRKTPQASMQNLTPEEWETKHSEFSKLIKRCVDLDPDNRPNIDDEIEPLNLLLEEALHAVEASEVKEVAVHENEVKDSKGMQGMEQPNNSISFLPG